MSKKRSLAEARGKAKQLWQLFFDDDYNGSGAAVAVDRTRAGDHHGVLYQGLLDAETDSDEELQQGVMMRRLDGELQQDVMMRRLDAASGDLSAKEQETLHFAKASSEDVQNYTETFDTREWEARPWRSETRHSARSQRLEQDGGETRFMIRSESDLELAIPARRRSKYCCLCFPSKDNSSLTFQYYSCIVICAVIVTVVYVAIVVGIVYGLK